MTGATATGQDRPQLQMLSGSDEPAARPGRAARPPPAPRTAPSEGGNAKAPVGDPQGAGWVLCGAVAFGLLGGWCHAAGRRPLSPSYTSWCSQPTARLPSGPSRTGWGNDPSPIRRQIVVLLKPVISVTSGCLKIRMLLRGVRLYSFRVSSPIESVFGCCGPPIGEPRYLVGERSGPDHARPGD